MRNKAEKKILLAVGGLDPSGSAGILADVRVWDFFGIPSRVALTAVTAQSRSHLYAWEAVSPRLFREQLRALEGPVWGVKIGMLATSTHLKTLSTYLQKNPPRLLLWDPVLAASTGGRLLRMSRPDAGFRRLLKQTDVFTPNVPEAEWLLGGKIRGLEGMEAAALQIAKLLKPGAAVVLKGGHLSGKDSAGRAVDVLAAAGKVRRLSQARQRGDPRGTGCHFGAALLANLALGKTLPAAARAAKAFVLKCLFS